MQKINNSGKLNYQKNDWMRLLLFCFLILIESAASAQKYDRNWVFGENAGVNFTNTDSIFSFRTETDNFEMTGCISDSTGSLLFHLTSTSSNAHVSDLFNNDGYLVNNGDSIRTYRSNASGTFIIPSYDSNTFTLLHLATDGNSLTCGYISCPKLFLSVVRKDSYSLIVEKKNHLLLNEYLFEKVAVVKHANGKDWWLIAHTEYDSAGIYHNRFYRFLISDTIVTGPYFQNVGAPTGEKWDYLGQMKFSRDGNFLALLRARTKRCEVYRFNRDNGLLSLFGTETIASSFQPYSLEFSPNESFLYITAGIMEFTSSELIQLKLTDTILLANLIETNYDLFAQIQLAPDGKIYIANMCAHVIEPQCNHYLSVIHQPDSAWPACDFRLYDFYLGDSSESTAGLPNMPDYNLPALSVYQADAGVNTIICLEDTTVKGVLLGTPPMSGVSYSWDPADGLNRTDIAQPFADPTTSTWYYVTISDSSSPNLCKSRVDSVLVEVQDCRVGIDAFRNGLSDVSLYPNPAGDVIYVVPLDQRFIVRSIHISDVSGREILQTSETAISIPHLARGLYFVRIEFEHGACVLKKVVVE